MKKTLLLAGVAMGALALMPAQADAKINSSMTASCKTTVAGSCTAVRFVLNLDGDFALMGLRITALPAGGWAFDGSPATWQGSPNSNSATASQITATWDSPYTQGTPYIVVAGIATDGSQAGGASLINGAFKYAGDANTPNPCTDGGDCKLVDEETSFSGVVTPEPVTVSLLLSGLVGVAGVARRRRKDDLG